MLLILKLLYTVLEDHFHIAGNDPRTRDLPLVSSYSMVLALIAGYVIIVLKIGPAFMAKRSPYNIKTIMQFYNILQILLNAYIFIGVTKYYLLQPQYNWFCMRYDTKDVSSAAMSLRHFTYLYYLTKVMDFLDTIFFVMRKKFNQVSFLHVYHHSAMVWAAFIYHNLAFGSHFTVIGHVNSFIHILMYTYYFLAALDINLDLGKWKPYMTQMQIIQFFYFTLKLGISIVDNWCELPMFWLGLTFTQNLFMTAMFSHFYWKNYVIKEKPNPNDLKMKK